ncbi:glycosyl hydrolase, partial [Pontiellaceae bacterium B12227]|nr:glycosyl hydrolase [Pontiellaceae bacterium B12227]
MKKTIGILLGLGLACGANAAILAGYDFSSSKSATTVASGASAGAVTAAGGAANNYNIVTSIGDNTGFAASGTAFGSTAAGCISSTSEGCTATDLAGAISDGDYYTVTITADVAGTLDLTGFSIDKAVRTNFIARVANEWNVCAKVNGDASAWSTTDALIASMTTTTSESLSPFESTFIDLSTGSSFGTTFQGLDSVEFRIYVWGASGASYSNAQRTDQIVVEGSVPEAPEPPETVYSSDTVFNLAKYQSRSADSANSSSTPKQYGNDGFVTQENRWVSDSTGSHWFEVELAVPMEIGSAHLYSGDTSNGGLSDFVLQYYNGSSWTDIAGTSFSGIGLREQNLSFDAPVTAQRFRLTTTDVTARIRELALYPPTSDGLPVRFGMDLDLNVAKMRQFAYSSVDGVNYPGLAIDGYVDDSSAWASTDAAGPHQFQVHFPEDNNTSQSELIRGIHLYSGFEGQPATVMEDFTVEYHNGSAWVAFSGGTVSGNTNENLSLWFDTAVAAAKVRVYTTDSKQAVIRELVVFAENDGDEYPLWTDALNQAPPANHFMEYENDYHSIENRSNGWNLSTSANGSAITTSEPQFQVLYNFGTDTFRLRSRETERCFEVSLASTNEGAAIVEGDYSSMPHQRWRLADAGDGEHVKIVNAWSGLVLGLEGTNVVQVADGSEFSKHWKINYETHFPKKGQASHFHFSFMYQASWAYRWTWSNENDLEYGQYYPMQNGSMSSATPGILPYQPGWYGRANCTVAMGFNEPDNKDQANMEAETAVYQWPRMERMRLPLLGPNPDGLNNTWRQDYEALAQEQGLRSEYMGMHEYEPLGASTGSPSTLFSRMQTLYNAYGKDIMLTEFAVRDFAGDKTTWSRNHVYNWLAEFMWRAEGVEYLKGWSIFEFGTGGDPTTTDACAASQLPTEMNSPKLCLHYNNDSTNPGYEDLTECGLLLAGWDGVDEVVNDKPYIIHNKGIYLRLIDDPSLSTVTTADILNTDQTEQFMLVEAAGGSIYIEGLSSGRRLSCDGSAVGLAAAGSADDSVKWELTAYQHGWYYIDHPSTGTRLRITGENAIDVVADSTAADNVRFRFIVPAVEFEAPAEAEGNVLVGYDFNASSSSPNAPSMIASSVSASSLSSPMTVAPSAGFGDTSGLDGTGVAFGSVDELGAMGISVDDAPTASFAAAVAGDDYVSFTVTPENGQSLVLSSISFKAIKRNAGSVDEYAVTDGSGTMIGSAVIATTVGGAADIYDSFVIDLAGTAYETLSAATEFRIYAWGPGTTSPWGTAAAIDKVVLRGGASTTPTAIAQSVETPEYTPVDITLTGSDVEGDPLTFIVASGPANGTLSGTAPDLTYTPDSDFRGADSFTFTVNDASSTSTPATVSISVLYGELNTIVYNFEDAGKIVDGTYETASDSYTGADSNTLAGVTASAFTLTDSRNQGTIGGRSATTGVTGGTIGGSTRAGLSANAADANSLHAMSFSVDIPANVIVDLPQVSFQYGHYTVNDDSSLMWYLKVIEGTTTNEYSRGSVWNDATAGYENDPEGVATVALTGMTDLTDTTVTFIWGFSGQRGNHIYNQSNWMDDIVLSGTSRAIEPVVSASVSGGSMIMSWEGGGSYNVLTNAYLM